ncbi:DUF4129 domain-containing protein [Thermogladius sp.]|uniref:DUF4129 domain-containing protein n=1 Tax=Thermogladius sp. TaxID=2023064 RepID=UPI003D13F9A2
MTRGVMVFLALLYVSMSAVASAQALETYRHTPGFTGFSLSDWQEIISSLQSGNLSASEAQKAASTIGTLINQTSQLGVSSSSLNQSLEALYSYFHLSSGNYTESDILNALSLLNNTDVKNTLTSLFFSYMFENRSVSDSDILSALERIETLWRQGKLTPSDYALALKLLSILARSEGYTYLSDRLDSESMRVAADALKAVTSQLPNLIPPNLGQPQTPTSGVKIGGLPSAAFPLFPLLSYLSIPEGLQTIVLVATVVATSILLSYLAPRLVGKVSALWSPTARRVKKLVAYAGRWGEAVEYYWRAVARIERATGVRLSPSNTHREYYNAVKSALGGLSPSFGRLTEIYEARRYAGDSRRDLDEEARRLYGDLVGKL